jgi:hypothetical protein
VFKLKPASVPGSDGGANQGNKKRILFSPFEAGMLLKTKDAGIVNGITPGNPLKTSRLQNIHGNWR